MTTGPDDDDIWLDEAAGPLIRPYTVNSGRTSPTVRLDLLSLVVAIGHDHQDLDPEHVRVLDLCRMPVSVAEIAAYMRLPVVVTKVLIADLVDRGAVSARIPPPPSADVDRALLEKLLDGLQRL